MINNILYSDEILHDDEVKKVIGEHKTSSIPNVKEEQLETILDIIFKSNPGIVFKTIQYSRKIKELIFYTDKNLSLKEYLEYYKSLPKPFQYKKLSSKEDVLNEIKDILNSDINTDSDCISLYDVSNLISNISDRIDGIEFSYSEEINSHFPYELFLSRKFCYNENVLKIAYIQRHSGHTRITFEKKDDDIFIKESNNWDNALYFFKKFSKEITGLYNELEKHKYFYTQKKENLHAVNSNFSVNINYEEITISTDDKINEYNFLITLDNQKYGNYDIKCNSNNILDVITGQTDKIFKRIFVKISDCPEWSQPLLINIRKEQLEEMRRIKENNKTKELNRQKRRARLKRLCPFIQ